MTHDTTPATKTDIAMLMDGMGRYYDKLAELVAGYKEETMRHFDVTVEKIRHDLSGANRDEIELLKDARIDHDNRLRTIETHLNIVR